MTARECPSCHARTEGPTGLCPVCGYVGRGIEVGDRCSVAGCGREPRAKGLCSGHYKARAEGRPLVPLRDRDAAAREVVSLRVSPECRERVLSQPSEARGMLERWARG